jgi:hypothetical protein
MFPKLKRVMLQLLIDRLLTWKAGMMSRADRTALAKKVTLSSAIAIHVSIKTLLFPWIIKVIDKLRRALVWMGTEAVSGGKCLMAWYKVTRVVGYVCRVCDFNCKCFIWLFLWLFIWLQ